MNAIKPLPYDMTAALFLLNVLGIVFNDKFAVRASGRFWLACLALVAVAI